MPEDLSLPERNHPFLDEAGRPVFGATPPPPPRCYCLESGLHWLVGGAALAKEGAMGPGREEPLPLWMVTDRKLAALQGWPLCREPTKRLWGLPKQALR